MKKLLALLLCLVMLFSIVPAGAVSAEEAEPVLQTADGEFVPDENWEDDYPFGSFAFGVTEGDVGEPGAVNDAGEKIPGSVTIPVYRVGGTAGRVTVKITYTPAVTTSADGTEKNYDYAASGKSDVRVAYENPSPIAAYQTIGLPLAERNMLASEYAVAADAGEEDLTEDAEITLYIDGLYGADSYRWQTSCCGGDWQDIPDATGAELPVSAGDLWDFENGAAGEYDFRCIYAAGAQLYCSVSAFGEAYVPYEMPGPAPADLPEAADPAYSVIEFENEYDMYEFELTFADGEDVKNIVITALDDDIQELPELGLLTIVGCEGGALCDLNNTCTIMVTDDDGTEPCELGFEVAEVLCDQDDGAALITVRRTGGSNYPVTVDYATADITAKAGSQYAATTGTLSFSGSIDELEITVPLIAEPARAEKLQFALTLSNLLGGTEEELASFAAGADTVTVTLTSGGKTFGQSEGQNLATVLANPAADDVSAGVTAAEDALIGKAEEESYLSVTETPEPVYATVEYPTRKYDYGGGVKLSFSRGNNYGNSYWHDWESVINVGTNFIGKKDHSTNGNYIGQLEFIASPTQGSASLQRKTSSGDTVLELDASYNFSDGRTLSGTNNLFDGMHYLMSYDQVGTKHHTWVKDCWLDWVIYIGPENSQSAWSGNLTDATERDYYWYSTNDPNHTQAWLRKADSSDLTYQAGMESFGFNQGDFGISAKGQMSKQWDQTHQPSKDEPCSEDNHAKVTICNLNLHRRAFGKAGLKLNIYTANDKYEMTDETYAMLDSSSPLYSKLIPSVTPVSGSGGFTSDGRLYFGSVLTVGPGKDTPSNWQVALDGSTPLIYLTDSKGNIVQKAAIVGSNNYQLKMSWDGITENDVVNGVYTLNVVYNRVQNIQVDITASVPRLKNPDGTDSGNIDTSKLYDAWSNFTSKWSFTVERSNAIGYSAGDKKFKDPISNGYSLSNLSDNGSAIGKPAALVNIQSINFHQDYDDYIVFNGRSFHGNATIYLTAADLSMETLTFLFYDSAYLDAERTMEVRIERTELYYDGDGDGKISGEFRDGVFTATGEDKEIGIISGDIATANLRPVVGSDGKLRQYFLKTFYMLTPRAFNTPANKAAARAQVIPAFFDAATDDASKAAATPDVESFRYISGDNTDNKPMYGAAASALSFVDIPLGGDASITEYHSETVTVKDKDGKETELISGGYYTWTPVYYGKLLFPFAHPEPVLNENNATGAPLPVAGEAAGRDGSGNFTYSTAGLAKLNSYLGAFVDRTGFALAVQEQKTSLSGLRSAAMILPESAAVGNVTTTPSVDNIVNTSGGSEKPGTQEGAMTEDTGYSEFSPDLGTKLPDLEFSLGDYVTLTMGDNEFALTIGIPLYKHEETKYNYTDTNTSTHGGTATTATHTEYAEDGTPTKVATTNLENSDGSTTKKTVKTTSAPDGKSRDVVTTLETTDANGNKTYKNITQHFETDANGKETKTTTINTNAPEVPSGKSFLKEGLKGANGQMGTIKDFFSSLGSKDKMKDFGKGLFDDETLANAKGGNTTSQKVSVSFTVQLAILFEYNPVENRMVFKNFGITFTAGVEITLQHRFSAFPLAYVYVKFGLSFSAALGVTVERKIKVRDALKDSDMVSGKYSEMGVARQLVFKLDMTKNRGFRMKLKGKVYMEVYDKSPDQADKPLASGTVNGTGEENDVVLEDYKKAVYIRLTGLSTFKSLSAIQPIYDTEAKSYFDGLSLTPSLSVEAGVGIGIEVLKFEVYVKTSVAITLTMAGYNFDTEKYEGFYVSNFDFSLAVGFNATVFFINYSMDCIGIYVNGAQHGTGGYFTWNITASAVGGNKVLWEKTTYSDKSGKPLDGPPAENNGAPAEAQGLVHINAPTDVSKTQKVASVTDSSAATRAIRPTGTAAFELSGYNTSGDAKELVSGLTAGYTYKLFSVGTDNYLLYPLMLNGTPRLVLSKVIMTGNLAEISGLEHPLNPESPTPFLAVDDDAFTDLEFDAVVNGSTVTFVWTTYDDAPSYATAVEAGAHTIVKLATLNFADSNAALSAPAVMNVSGAGYRYLPSAEGVYAESSGTDISKNDALKAYLLATTDGLTEEELTAGTTDNALHATAVYQWNTQSLLNTLYGDTPVLRRRTGRTADLYGEVPENLEAVTVNGRTYVGYSTSQTVYFDTSVNPPVTVSAENIDSNTERGTIRRLYLREFSGNGWGEAKLLQIVIDFDHCDDDSLSTAALKDGIYVNGSVVDGGQADPYYSNLQFVTADLTGSGTPETLFLFEMGGNTYLMHQADYTALLDGTAQTAEITPVFSEATGTDVTVGSDGTNLAVVYTAPVANTVNNALYIAYWDKNLNTWGNANILAMNHLQIYEDSITYDMEPEDAEQAYLGKLTTEGGHTGAMDRLTFSNLQMTTRTVDDGEGSTSTCLMVLTEAAKNTLTEATFQAGGDETFTSVIADGPADVGFYAIAFGVGEQALGESSLQLSSYNFSAGDILIGELNLTNTGTVAIRASDANPMTVILNVIDGSSTEQIGKWTLTESLPSGGKLNLNFRSAELPTSLKAGATFCATVIEDPAYFGANAFYARIDDLLTVEEKPELMFGSFSTQLSRIENGKAYLDFTAEVLNTGNKTADEIWLQFSCATEEADSYGNHVYEPINLTGSTLTTGKQEAITRRVNTDLANGIYLLNNAEDGGSIDPGHLRRVEGILAVPVGCFADSEEFSGLHLKAEIFSDADSTNREANGLYTSDHGEYCGTNNDETAILNHTTIFEAPAQISAALGNTVNLPVSFNSTVANNTVTVTELSDGSEDWAPRMGILYYDAERSVIVAAPNASCAELIAAGKVPAGILRLEDSATNTVCTVAYKITELGSGINIYKDDASYTFYNANGTLTDVNAAESGGQSWRFMTNVPANSWAGGASVSETPMNNDLSVARDNNAKVTFETVADTMTLYFNGTVTVNSSFLNAPVTSSQSPLTVNFRNDFGASHTVTVTASAGTQLDRYTATYKTAPYAQADSSAPQIYWSRSFPDTASVLSGGSVTVTCYVLDNSGLVNVTFNGQTPPGLTKVSDKYWSFPVTFTENGSNSVRALDTSGNISVSPVSVDWFNSVLSIGSVATAPDFDASMLSFTNDSGQPATGVINYLPWMTSSYALQPGETSSGYPFSDGFAAQLTKEDGGERWRTVGNGYYMVRVDNENGTWSQAVIPLTNVDKNIPVLTLYYDSGLGSLAWTASKAGGTARLKTAKINGYSVFNGDSIAANGTLPVGLNGEYTLAVTDSAGNPASVTYSVTDILPSASFCDMTVTGISNWKRNNGVVTVDLTKAVGAYYDASISNPANGVYKGRYRVALVRADYDMTRVFMDETIGWQTGVTGDVLTFTKVKSGDWLLILARTDENVFGTVPITVDENNLPINKVVMYTDLLCNTKVVPWSVVDGANARYFSEGEGTYAIADGENNMEDIRGLWGEEYIDFMVRRQLFYGVDDTHFDPNGQMTRAMFVAVLYRMAGSPEVTGKTPFTDLKQSWYKTSVLWAYQTGVTSGTTATTFSPNEPITREQMCAFLIRFVNLMGLDMGAAGSPKKFSDSNQISAWARKDVNTCTAAGIVNGTDTGEFLPKDPATRMEICTVMTQFITKCVNETGVSISS